ncbi:MAG: hypothetical protein P0Y53_19450 [Candidatus Pseudobacter hemicellulosilyticus]|uniref:Uncharacterized protein n=1 Tax=Candidatus Pseudobacter hemicellulosilyticus TaxID=3121375 RepID=A0AAJ6BF19_9BACT|nr:MAG: hypothetical protein P0Y53_19450 [Pseudobacter sp.]
MNIKLLEYKEIAAFPSGSGIEYHDEKMFLVGDDAREILVLNKRWKELERLPLFESSDPRATLSLRSDLEATTVVTVNRIPRLLILGSGSRETNRNKGVLVDLDSYLKEDFDLTPFYKRLQENGVHELNIETAALVEDHILLANRGNHLQPANQVIITKNAFWKKQQQAEIAVVSLDLPVKDNHAAGITGLAYSLQNDCLVFTASTELTDGPSPDGPVGDSYLGIIENASRKIGRRSLKINELLNLSDTHELFKGFKVQSVCIQSEKTNRLKLHLVADNDTNRSYLFKVRVKW